jgi:hypothetical protein
MKDQNFSLQLEKAVPELLNDKDPALEFFTRRDLLRENPGSIAWIQSLPDVQQIIENEDAEGCWSYPGTRKNAHPTEKYQILQTYRMLGELIDRYEMDRSQPAVERAANFLFSQQTAEGDFRGIFGSQYAPHYSAGILELLIKAGFQDDARVALAFDWFESHRQEDGGWAWPLRTADVEYQDAIERETPIHSDFSKPFSHALTGFVIRAYAAHPRLRTAPIAVRAGELLNGRFFTPDKYADRRAASYWLKYQFPFWWGNLLTALNSLSRMGFSQRDPDIQRGLEWFQKEQLENGLWPTGYDRGNNAPRNQAWVALAVCRMLISFTA